MIFQSCEIGYFFKNNFTRIMIVSILSKLKVPIGCEDLGINKIWDKQAQTKFYQDGVVGHPLIQK